MIKKGRLFSESFIAFVKQRKSLVLLGAALLGVLLAVLPLFSSGGSEGTAESEDSLDKYKLELEGELSELCSEVYGAGRCLARVSFSSGFRFEYKGSSLISKTPPKIDGVTVLCEGAGNSEVRREISSLIAALYGIGHNRICVLKLSS